MFTLIGLLFAGSGTGLLYLGLRGGPTRVRRETADDYLRSLEFDPSETDEFQQLLEEPFLQRVLRPITTALIGTASGVLPRNLRDQVHYKLVLAGLTSRYRAEEIVTAQILAAVGGLVIAILLAITGILADNLSLLAMIALPILGVQAPRSSLTRKVEERQGSIRRDLPDTLDLLAISVEAGVGFEAALGIVAENFDSPLADELTRTIHEMELGLPRRQALDNLRRRTDVAELSNFIITLVQADSLGMPIGRVLKTQAGEMRLRRRAWAREKAAKLPVKILAPLMPILVAIFIVILGPAVSSMQSAF